MSRCGDEVSSGEVRAGPLREGWHRGGSSLYLDPGQGGREHGRTVTRPDPSGTGSGEEEDQTPDPTTGGFPGSHTGPSPQGLRRWRDPDTAPSRVGEILQSYHPSCGPHECPWSVGT